eukprot:757237-Pleurochrysis_carterae.AAC.1
MGERERAQEARRRSKKAGTALAVHRDPRHEESNSSALVLAAPRMKSAGGWRRARAACKLASAKGSCDLDMISWPRSARAQRTRKRERS